MKTKKISLFLVIILLLSFCTTKPVLASKHTDTTPYSWYVKRNSEHIQPDLDPTLGFIDNYSCYYLDKNADDKNKVVYLTFDAGYENGNIEKILDAMAAHNAKGAFFVLENLFVRNPDLVKRMVNEGHIVANHTLNHLDMSKIKNVDEFSKELSGLSELYKNLIGNDMPKYYRPPEGRFSELNLKMLEELGYKTILWSFAYADWDNQKQPSEEYALKKILDNLHNGAIILLHPTSATNAAIMDRLLTEIENQGYRFGSIDEIKAGII